MVHVEHDIVFLRILDHPIPRAAPQPLLAPVRRRKSSTRSPGRNCGTPPISTTLPLIRPPGSTMSIVDGSSLPLMMSSMRIGVTVSIPPARFIREYDA